MCPLVLHKLVRERPWTPMGALVLHRLVRGAHVCTGTTHASTGAPMDAPGGPGTSQASTRSSCVPWYYTGHYGSAHGRTWVPWCFTGSYAELMCALVLHRLLRERPWTPMGGEALFVRCLALHNPSECANLVVCNPECSESSWRRTSNHLFVPEGQTRPKS